MDILQAARSASQDPRIAEALGPAVEEFSDVAPEQLDELIKLLELALQRPDAYPQIREAALQDDMVDPEDLPEQFDGQLLLSVLVALYRMRDKNAAQQAPDAMPMRRGGLAEMRRLAARGRMGDTMLAHISPEEAAMLKARGGAGTINPNTGLPQYFSLKKLFKAILPIALNFIVPGLGAAIGGALGATGVAATMLGQAVLGGLTAGVTGGNVLQGMLLGGMTGGLGSSLGGGISDALGLGLGQTAQNVLGGALVGGVSGAATGQGFGRGALMGAVGGGIGSVAQGLGSGAVGAGIGAGGQTFGNMLATGYSPKEALLGGALSGVATGAMYKPQGPAGGGMRVPEPGPSEGLRVNAGPGAELSRYGTTDYITGEQGVVPGSAPQLYAPENAAYNFGEGVSGPGMKPSEAALSAFGPQPAQQSSFGGSPLKTAGQLFALSNAFGGMGQPEAARQAVRSLSPEQQEYFNRPNIKWDWGRMQSDAAARNMSLGQFMAAYWPQISSGTYNLSASAPTTPESPPAASPMPPGDFSPGLARGGLGSVARLVRGGGTGREDKIPARLSDGEYVMDAETVALLGDGSTRAGAQRLDEFRAKVRKHKGEALARGKFSPNAKPLARYMGGM